MNVLKASPGFECELCESACESECVEDGLLFCGVHASSHASKRGHTLTAFEFGKRCSAHPRQPITWFCPQENLPLCDDCRARHKTCNFMPIDTALKLTEMERTQLLHEVHSQIAVFDVPDNDRSQLAEKYEMVKQQVIAGYEKAIKEIEAAMQQQLRQLENRLQQEQLTEQIVKLEAQQLLSELKDVEATVSEQGHVTCSNVSAVRESIQQLQQDFAASLNQRKWITGRSDQVYFCQSGASALDQVSALVGKVVANSGAGPTWLPNNNNNTSAESSHHGSGSLPSFVKQFERTLTLDTCKPHPADHDSRLKDYGLDEGGSMFTLSSLPTTTNFASTARLTKKTNHSRKTPSVRGVAAAVAQPAEKKLFIKLPTVAAEPAPAGANSVNGDSVHVRQIGNKVQSSGVLFQSRPPSLQNFNSQVTSTAAPSLQRGGNGMQHHVEGKLPNGAPTSESFSRNEEGLNALFHVLGGQPVPQPAGNSASSLSHSLMASDWGVTQKASFHQDKEGVDLYYEESDEEEDEDYEGEMLKSPQSMTSSVASFATFSAAPLSTQKKPHVHVARNTAVSERKFPAAPSALHSQVYAGSTFAGPGSRRLVQADNSMPMMHTFKPAMHYQHRQTNLDLQGRLLDPLGARISTVKKQSLRGRHRSLKRPNTNQQDGEFHFQ